MPTVPEWNLHVTIQGPFDEAWIPESDTVGEWELETNLIFKRHSRPLPTLTITLDKYLIQGSETALVTFSFSTTPVGFALEDIDAPNGSLSFLSSTANPLIYTALFTPNAGVVDFSNVITVGTGWTDAVGNHPKQTTTSGNYTVNTVNLTVEITSTEGSPTALLPIPIIFTLSEPSTDFVALSVTVGGGTIANFAGAGTSYTADATPTIPNGTMTFDVADNAFHDAAGNGNTAATQLSMTSNAFTIADEFTDTRAAGSVNGTAATPVGGNRVCTDTNSKISVGLGVLAFATGEAANDGIWYSPAVARGLGKTVIVKMKIAAAGISAGWDISQSGPMDHGAISLGTSSIISSLVSNSRPVGSYAADTDYIIAVVMRPTGALTFIKGGEFTNWTILFTHTYSEANNVYAGATVSGTTSILTIDYIRMPANAIVITPLASDNFTAGDGALGNTRGGASEEAGGTGKAWASQLGTWGISTNKAACSALDGGTSVGIATVPLGTANVLAEVVATRAAGTSGLCLRYTDSNNYIKAVHNGTNLQIIEVVAGTPNTLINSVVAYNAAARMIISLNANKIRAYYGATAVEGAVGTEAITTIITGNNHGLFTDDTGATFDNFLAFAKGNGGEYANVLGPYATPLVGDGLTSIYVSPAGSGIGTLADPADFHAALTTGKPIIMTDGVYTAAVSVAITANLTADTGARPVIVGPTGYPTGVTIGSNATVTGIWFGGLRPANDTGYKTITMGSSCIVQDCTFFNYINCIQNGSDAMGNIYRRNRFVNCGYQDLHHPLYVANLNSNEEADGVLSEENILLGCEGYSVHYYHEPSYGLAQYNFIGDARDGLALQGDEGGPVSGNRNIIWTASGNPLYDICSSGNCDHNVFRGCTSPSAGGSGSFDSNYFVVPVATAGTTPFVWHEDDVVSNLGDSSDDIDAAISALETSFTASVADIHDDATIETNFATLKAVIDTWKTK